MGDTYRSASWRDVRIGTHVRVRFGREHSGPRNGGIVRVIEEDHVLVEPDYPDVDENGDFNMWRCSKHALLVETKQC